MDAEIRLTAEVVVLVFIVVKGPLSLNTWCSLKVHTQLNKPAAFCCSFV